MRWLVFGLAAGCAAKAPAVDATAAGPWSEVSTGDVEVQYVKRPKFPRAADQGAEATCMARVYVRSSGKPERVEVSGCDEPFHKATHKALLAWRFTPPQVEGQPAQVVLDVAVKFRQR